MLSLSNETPIKIGDKFYYLVDERVYVSGFINLPSNKKDESV